jgi:hypothetical protein
MTNSEKMYTIKTCRIQVINTVCGSHFVCCLWLFFGDIFCVVAGLCCLVLVFVVYERNLLFVLFVLGVIA